MTDDIKSKVNMQGNELRTSGNPADKGKWPSVAIVSLTVCGIALFRLLSQGAISQGVALWAIPSCFMIIAAIITCTALMKQQK